MFESKLYVFHIFLMAVCVCLLTPFALCNEEGDASISDEGESKDFDVKYETPKFPTNAYAFEHLDDKSKFSWVKSKAKKDDVDENISKYDGIWEVESTEKNALKGDFGLVLKSKAKHSAIAFKLKKPFAFKEKSLVVQYEVHLQNGQECGGAYIKLLSASKGAIDLKNFNDKTPYTIMFGPDKCGNDYKLHFIFRHVNPLNKNIEEKHCKKPNIKLDEILNDKQPHLYTLIVRPDNSFEISVDHQIVNSGNLLEDFTPPVNPPKEIDDPEDVKPEDWDERERIPDPSAVKPEDWDEDAPMKLVDKDAKMPSGWLEEEPQYIHDPTSEKPDDWDNEMDGEWEAPLIPNPKCEGAPGCGEWVQPMIDNPNYKGKWRAPMINNPNYQGKWSPRKIPNPGYFEDLEPFKMTPIGAVGIELWSMSNNIYFDNILITDDVEEARQVASETFDLKQIKISKGQAGFMKKFIDFSNENPWIYAVYVLALAIPIVIIFVCCCGDSQDSAATKKKTDAPTKDDPIEQPEKQNSEKDEGNLSSQDDDQDPDMEILDDEENVDDIEAEKSDSDHEVVDTAVRTSPRLRKVRRE